LWKDYLRNKLFHQWVGVGVGVGVLVGVREGVGVGAGVGVSVGVPVGIVVHVGVGGGGGLVGVKGGVNIEKITKDMSDFTKILDTGNPDADSEGYVLMPNVDLPTEMINLTIATRAYEANAAVLKRYQKMVDTTLELLR
jgi:hypothetical protein